MMTRALVDAPETVTETMIIGRFASGLDYLTERPHGARRALIMLTLGGAGRIALGGGPPQPATPGTVAYLPVDTPHVYGTDPTVGSWTFWWAHYRPRLGWPTPHDGVTELAPDVAADIDRRFADLHAAARWPGTGAVPPVRPGEVRAGGGSVDDTSTAGAHGSDARRAGGGAPALLRHQSSASRPDVDAVDEVLATAPAGWRLAAPLLEALLVLVTQPDEDAGAAYDPRVARALALVAADPSASHSVASLASAVALSPSRLAHLAAVELGEPLMQRVRTIRLAHAARLLTETSLTVAQVAHASGFASPFHFSRAYRSAYGHPPSRAR